MEQEEDLEQEAWEDLEQEAWGEDLEQEAWEEDLERGRSRFRVALDRWGAHDPGIGRVQTAMIWCSHRVILAESATPKNHPTREFSLFRHQIGEEDRAIGCVRSATTFSSLLVIPVENAKHKNLRVGNRFRVGVVVLVIGRALNVVICSSVLVPLVANVLLQSQRSHPRRLLVVGDPVTGSVPSARTCNLRQETHAANVALSNPRHPMEWERSAIEMTMLPLLTKKRIRS